VDVSINDVRRRIGRGLQSTVDVVSICSPARFLPGAFQILAATHSLALPAAEDSVRISAVIRIRGNE
jgi:hypothetical protein